LEVSGATEMTSPLQTPQPENILYPDSDGQRFLSYVELMQECDELEQQCDRLPAKLKELGIDLTQL
jgi:hypothetical protein